MQFCCLPAWGQEGTAVEDADVISRVQLTEKSDWEGEFLFERVSSERSGVKMSYDLDLAHPMRRLYAFGWATGNVAIGDLNGDRKADLFFAGTTGPNRVFLQGSDFQFREVSLEVVNREGEEKWASLAIMGDVDNDRDLDVLVLYYDHPCELLINQSENGKLNFVNRAAEWGLEFSDGVLNASFADYDLDGFLDLYVQTYHLEPESGRPQQMNLEVKDGEVVVPKEWELSYLGFLDKEGNPRAVESPLADRMYVHDKEGKFEQINKDSRVGFYGASHVVWDADHDVKPDLYLGNDSHGPDLNYRMTANGFSESASRIFPFTPWFSRGGVAADFNNDLLIDFLATNSAPLTKRDRLGYGEPFRADLQRVLTSGGAVQVNRNTLFANTGTFRFWEMARMAGLAQTGATWAVKVADFDLDGRKDLFFATGEARDWTKMPSADLVGDSLVGKTRWDLLKDLPMRKERDLAYRNEGDWQFTETGKKWGLDFEGMSYSAGVGDLDGDGDLDLVVCPLGEEVMLYRNHCQQERVVLELDGERSNELGIGAEMLSRTGLLTQVDQLYPTGGFKGSDEPVFSLGLGKEGQVGKVTISWGPSRSSTTLEKLDAGYRYKVREVRSVRPALSRLQRPKPLFIGSNALRAMGYQEQPLSASAETQAMLPAALDSRGPALAIADLDRDDRVEIFLGGSENIDSRLVSGSNRLAGAVDSIATYAKWEDAGAVFFDANGDGLQDLYVGSSGMVSGDEEKLRMDRFFLLDRTGKYIDVSSSHLPPAVENTSAVAATDFDRDGDLDLFVGSHHIPGKFPAAGRSRLLQNGGDAKFVDATSILGNGLESAGLVNAALWSDVDNDGWIDLLLACDWGEIQLWRNREGRLERDMQPESGLAERSGRWNSIAGADFDNDGDIDYVVGNEGSNSSLRASREQPALLIAGDFAGSGKWIPLTFVEGLPLRDWEEWKLAGFSADQIGADPPAFVEKLSDELSLDVLKTKAEVQLQVNELRNGVFINDGSGRFQFEPLPHIAQLSQAMGIVCSDFNSDGKTDVFMMQNRGRASLEHPEEIGCGVGVVLMGSGSADSSDKDRFVPVRPQESGIVIYGYGRSAAVADVNRDARPDLVVGINGSDPGLFTNEYEGNGRTKPFQVQLNRSTGKKAAGARVEVTIPDFPTQTAEYYAGGGYLSQSPRVLFFASPEKPSGNARVKIRWSDGTVSNRTVYFSD